MSLSREDTLLKYLNSYSQSKIKKGTMHHSYGRDFGRNFKLMPPIYEEAETSPCYREEDYMGDYGYENSSDDYREYMDEFDKFPGYSCNPYPPCYPEEGRLVYEDCHECDIQPMYEKIPRRLPADYELPIMLPESQCPPPKLCSPNYLPTIIRKYHGRVGNPKVLAEYVDVLDHNCCPRRIFSKEYSDTEKLRQTGFCYTYKVKRKDSSRYRVDEPRVVHRFPGPKKYIVNETVRTRYRPEYAPKLAHQIPDPKKYIVKETVRTKYRPDYEPNIAHQIERNYANETVRSRYSDRPRNREDFNVKVKIPKY